MTTGMDWTAQVGRSWADNYRLTDRSFSGLTGRLLERISEYDGNTVLDIGCGAGELALAVARQRPGAEVVGVDVSPDLITVANERGAQHGNARFVHGDAASWTGGTFAPDLLVSRHGVMFFDDPPAAFANLHAASAEGARMVFSCFRAPGENPWASEISALIGVQPSADPTAPGPFAFADPDHVTAILTAGGWQDPHLEAFNFAYVAGKGEDPVQDALALFRYIGPAAATLRQLQGDDRTRAEGWLREWLEEHRSGDLVAFSAGAWIVTARH
ncbi:class I SAM-dependent methyltransferase [Novosphingobium aquiterrae]|uniref:Class I SAM-dependent methyltransferase n=1 Tax=Novosphingobium aquiterrae TaxID=624388 RepID=A0ABV6PG72_9SPHN